MAETVIMLPTVGYDRRGVPACGVTMDTVRGRAAGGDELECLAQAAQWQTGGSVITTAVGEMASAGGSDHRPGVRSLDVVSVAVVWRPVASRIENVSGSTQAPLVIASKNPPFALTVELVKTTPPGTST